MHICYTFTWVVWWILSGLMSISTSPFNVNSYYPIARGRVDGLLWTRSTSINITSVITRGIVAGQNWPPSTTSAIARGRVSGLLRPMPTTFTTSKITWVIMAGIKRPMPTIFLTWIHSDTFFFRTFISALNTELLITAGITIPISYTSITPHRE